MCDPKLLAFYSEQFGASGAARNFAEARVQTYDGDESLYYSQKLSERCPGIGRGGLDGCHGQRLAWESPSRARPQELSGWAFLLLPMPLPPQGGVLTQGHFSSGHEQIQLMLKIEHSRIFWQCLRENKMLFL